MDIVARQEYFGMTDREAEAYKKKMRDRKKASELKVELRNHFIKQEIQKIIPGFHMGAEEFKKFIRESLSKICQKYRCYMQNFQSKKCPHNFNETTTMTSAKVMKCLECCHKSRNG